LKHSSYGTRRVDVKQWTTLTLSDSRHARSSDDTRMWRWRWMWYVDEICRPTTRSESESRAEPAVTASSRLPAVR